MDENSSVNRTGHQDTDDNSVLVVDVIKIMMVIKKTKNSLGRYQLLSVRNELVCATIVCRTMIYTVITYQVDVC